MRSGASRRAPIGSTTPQLDQISPSFYTDGEEALEAGTELEEKAERFAIGWKAEKYFEKSLAMYQRAMRLNEKSQDAFYNCARVLFILATGFHAPPKSISTLQLSVTLYRQSLSLIPPTEMPDGTPSAFYLDVQFNLAVALLALADQYEQSQENVTTRITVVNDAIIQFNSVINEQEVVLHRQKMEEQVEGEGDDKMAESEMSSSPLRESAGAAEMEGDKQTRSEYTTSLITPASALETLHNLHLSSLALLDVLDDDRLIQDAVQISTTSLLRAQSIFLAFPDGEQRSPDEDWFENVSALRYASLEIRVAEISKKTTLSRLSWADAEQSIRSTSEEAMREANNLLTIQSNGDTDLSTTIGRSKQRSHSQQLEQLGDLLLTLGRTVLYHMHAFNTGQQGNIAPLGQQAWSLLSLSSKLFLAALQSLDTSSTGAGTSAVLGASNVSNTTTRRRCSLYTSLSTVSLLRSDLLFFQSIETLTEKSREQLLNNGRIYSRKAVTEIGLGWLLTDHGRVSKAQYTLPHGGLDSLRGESDAILTLLRSLYLRSALVNDDAQEVQAVCSNVKKGLLEGSSGETWKAILSSPDGASQGVYLLDQVIGEEGEGAISTQERHFWLQVESSLL
jgi:tetratricopeptide (TPR) repeat protein